MNLDENCDSGELQVKLRTISADIWGLANSYEGNSLALLALLRALEQAHRQIRENLFQSSLPDNRQNLYALLKDIEDSGGWPYVERMKLRFFLDNLPEQDNPQGGMGNGE